MKGMTVLRAAAICGGTINSKAEDREIRHIVIDSRLVQEGDMFVAFVGEKLDGHDYIKAALERGAACCLAQRMPEGVSGAVIVVDDVQEALEAIAAEYRRELSLPVIGITGSVGKTSAKEMIASVLSEKYNTLKTEGNLNNQIGVPMTLSAIEQEHEAAVIEMGISGFGEMRHLAAMVCPDVAVYTVIGHAHLEFLHDLDGVFMAKTEMLELMQDNGIVIANGDDEKLRGIKCRQRLLLFGTGEHCDIRAENIRAIEGGTACTITFADRIIEAEIPAYGRHMVYAALEGAAVGIVMGLSNEEIQHGINGFRVVGRRGALNDTGFLRLIDDCYNANPDSMRCAIDSLMELPGRHVCILADMLEMGENTKRLNYEVGAYASERGVELVIATGRLGRLIAEGAGENSVYFAERSELIKMLPTLLKKGDNVLVKASNSMKLGEVADAVKQIGDKE